MLGQDLVLAAREAGAVVVGMDLPEIDITEWQSVRAAMTIGSGTRADPTLFYDVVVNCAAWTKVDDAEDHEAEAFAINAIGPANLARAARKFGAMLVQVSTDYVFDGEFGDPYRAVDRINPKSAYGRTKAAGEWAVMANTDEYLIVRTAWLYGAGGPNFPKTMARLAAERDTLTVVDDQMGQPTWTGDLADLIVRLVAAEAEPGIYHGTSSGAVTWNGFAKAIMEALGSETRVEPVSSAAFAAKAPRPSYSVLDHGSLEEADVEPIGDWAERWAVAAPVVLQQP
ncbi:MAG: dTDP-4-dehydrorhamnose reductase [Promicromonosporaceae bacterium]|nr:dTDP-4-dehydrorhamnose reductase [Promicromonosporaceae bacterium]